VYGQFWNNLWRLALKFNIIFIKISMVSSTTSTTFRFHFVGEHGARIRNRIAALMVSICWMSVSVVVHFLFYIGINGSNLRWKLWTESHWCKRIFISWATCCISLRLLRAHFVLVWWRFSPIHLRHCMMSKLISLLLASKQFFVFWFKLVS
jgi:hypothetical protein